MGLKIKRFAIANRPARVSNSINGMTQSPPPISTARRIGILSAAMILTVGLLYLGVITTWLIVEGTPQAPIGDPYLAIMEGLTILSALALIGLLVALIPLAALERRVYALMALVMGSLAAGLTMTVHFVQLTAVRQLWHIGQLPDYRLVWPSLIFAVEYFAWDGLIGLSLMLASLTLVGNPQARAAHRALMIGGSLCLMGAIGPLSGYMLLQNLAVLGYAVVLPLAAALSWRWLSGISSANQ